MKKLLYILFMSLCCTAFLAPAGAQVPGYMGKRWSLHYNAEVFPAFYAPRYSPDFSNLTRVGMNLTHEFTTDYVMSRNTALGVSFRLNRTAVKANTVNNLNPLDPYDNDATYFYFLDLKDYWYGFYLKHFHYRRKGSIAPVGQYSRFELAFGRCHSDTGKLMSTNVGNVPGGYTALHIQPVPTVFSLIYTYGVQQVFYKRFYFDAGISFALTPAGLPFMAFWSPSESDGGIENRTGNQVRLNQFIHGRMSSLLAMNMSFGVGILLH